jgi:hypothetical protein
LKWNSKSQSQAQTQTQSQTESMVKASKQASDVPDVYEALEEDAAKKNEKHENMQNFAAPPYPPSDTSVNILCLNPQFQIQFQFQFQIPLLTHLHFYSHQPNGKA